MLILPIDPTRPLLLLFAPTPQFKDRAAGVPATDRDTGAPLLEATLALPSENGAPQVLRVSIPAPGVPDGLGMGQMVKATGLTFLTGVKNGRTWQIFRAAALNPASSSPTHQKAPPLNHIQALRLEHDAPAALYLLACARLAYLLALRLVLGATRHAVWQTRRRIKRTWPRTARRLGLTVESAPGSPPPAHPPPTGS